jgi:hypothetical protein
MDGPLEESAMFKPMFALAGALALATFGVAQAGEGSGHPFDMAGQSPAVVAGAAAQNTGSEALPTFPTGGPTVQANVAGRDTGSDAYQDYAGQPAGMTGSTGLASR